MIQQAFDNLKAAKAAAEKSDRIALENNTVWIDGVTDAEFAATSVAQTSGCKSIAEYRVYSKSLRRAAAQAKDAAQEAHESFMEALRTLPEGSDERKMWARRAMEL